MFSFPCLEKSLIEMFNCYINIFVCFLTWTLFLNFSDYSLDALSKPSQAASSCKNTISWLTDQIRFQSSVTRTCWVFEATIASNLGRLPLSSTCCSWSHHLLRIWWTILYFINTFCKKISYYCRNQKERFHVSNSLGDNKLV